MDDVDGDRYRDKPKIASEPALFARVFVFSVHDGVGYDK